MALIIMFVYSVRPKGARGFLSYHFLNFHYPVCMTRFKHIRNCEH